MFTFHRGLFYAPLVHDFGSQLTSLWPLDGTAKAWPSGGFDLAALEDLAERFDDSDMRISDGP